MSNRIRKFLGKTDVTPYYKMGGTWFILIIISILGIIDIPVSEFLSLPVFLSIPATVLVASLKASIILSLIIVSRRIKWLHILILSMVVIYSLLCIINAAGYFLYDMGISITMITLIGQTTKTEIMEFLPTALTAFLRNLRGPAPYLWLAGAVLGVIVFRRLPLRIVKWLMIVMPCGGIICMALILSRPSDRSNISIPLRCARAIFYASREMHYIQEQLAKIPPLPDSASVRSRLKTDIIMVVGESASRDHLSIYGYDLPTTPEFDRLKDRLIIFDNVIGSSTITVKNLKRILTFLNDSDALDNWIKAPMLFSLLNKAGYHTSWISNQEIGGLWGNSTSAIVSMADNVKFVGNISSEDALVQKYDEILLPEISNALSSGHNSKFIGVHLMGSHFTYRQRYPEKFSYFSADSILKSPAGTNLDRSQAEIRSYYDNSIRYTDYILSEIIKDISPLTRPTLLIYFSDHGENVYDDGGNYCGRDERHVEVPFIICPNEAFIAAYPDVISRLKEVCLLPMPTASVCHLICGLTSTEYSHYDPTRDISSPQYHLRPRYVDDNIWKYEKVTQ